VIALNQLQMDSKVEMLGACTGVDSVEVSARTSHIICHCAAGDELQGVGAPRVASSSRGSVFSLGGASLSLDVFCREPFS
jgi:hypothetical protein